MYDIIAAVGFFFKSLINSSMINFFLGKSNILTLISKFQDGTHVRKILLFLLFIAIQSVIEALRTKGT